MHEKALTSAADEVVLDLEDAVAPEAKDDARAQVEQTLSGANWVGRAVAVRVNAAGTPQFEADLAACARMARDGFSVVLPKAEDAATLAAVADALPAGTPVHALIETPAGLVSAAAIAAAPNVSALILGYADLAAALGRRGAEQDLDRWLVARELLLTAARAGRVEAIDGPYFRLGDPAGLEVAVRGIRELGFDAKWAIHPEQVGPINDGLAAGPDEHQWAADVQNAVAAAAASGSAVARMHGQMVDEAMVRRSRRIAALPARAAAPAAEADPEPEAGKDDGVTVILVGSPFFDDLNVGDVFPAPGLTITDGHAALHQATIGDRLRLSLDAPLYEAVTGTPGLLAHPALVCDIAIGQSTAPSGRVLGNLFYSGLACRPVAVGATLRTRTEVVALKSSSRGRGIAALRITTTDTAGRDVLDFWRCPLLPSSPLGPDAPARPEHADDLGAVGRPVDAHALVPATWNLQPLREEPLGPLFADIQTACRYVVEAGETVTSAPELARLSLNLAMTHTDGSKAAHGQRLVYGGHVIGIAAAHVVRVLPDLATVLAWHGCDHLGPTFEGDLLRTTVELTKLEPLPDGGLVHFRACTAAQGPDPEDRPRDVLDWSAVALMP